MKRREFIAVGGAMAVTSSWPAVGQPRPPRIGYLVHSPLIDPPSEERAAFLDELQRLGYVIGQNLLIDYRSAENEPEFFPQLVEELLKLHVDLIYAAGGTAAVAAKAATTRIPIVFAQSPDPVGSGLVKSLARPETNATGLSFIAPDLAGKRLQLLREVLPSAKRVAVVWGALSASMANEVKASTDAAARLGMRAERFPIEDAGQLTGQFERIAKSHPDALLVLADLRLVAYRDIVIEWANRNRVPTVAGWPDFVRGGGLLSYSPSYEALFRRSAHYVDKILRGAKPGDLPVEQPTKFDLVINLRTAKALGLTIPPSMLLRADEVIR